MTSRDGLGPWCRSTYSGGNGNCVEVASFHAHGRAVRDSKTPAGPVLAFPGDGWAAFLAVVTSSFAP